MYFVNTHRKVKFQYIFLMKCENLDILNVFTLKLKNIKSFNLTMLPFSILSAKMFLCSQTETRCQQTYREGSTQVQICCSESY